MSHVVWQQVTGYGTGRNGVRMLILWAVCGYLLEPVCVGSWKDWSGRELLQESQESSRWG